jgi:hypothetical protein
MFGLHSVVKVKQGYLYSSSKKAACKAALLAMIATAAQAQEGGADLAQDLTNPLANIVTPADSAQHRQRTRSPG